MRRREFVALIGSVAATWLLAARAQSAMPVVGFMSARAPGESIDLVSAFYRGLREVGFIEGQNVIIAFRWAEGHLDRLPILAKELIDLHVAVLFAAGGSPAAFAAKTATQTIPVVFSAVIDPVGVDLVASLSRPGGNVTGMSFTAPEVVAKDTQLLKELVPGALPPKADMCSAHTHVCFGPEADIGRIGRRRRLIVAPRQAEFQMR